MLDAGRSEAEIPRTREYWMLDKHDLFPLIRGCCSLSIFNNFNAENVIYCHSRGSGNLLQNNYLRHMY
jgi:hypothetical protein